MEILRLILFQLRMTTSLCHSERSEESLMTHAINEWLAYSEVNRNEDSSPPLHSCSISLLF